ncbi:MAG: hypothetical protein K6U11_03055 [bacterium]|nr:hypothetical protein [bacterium]
MLKKWGVFFGLSIVCLMLFSVQAQAAISYTCYWDVINSSCNCSGPVNIVPGPGPQRGVVEVDMTNYTTLTVDVEFKTPQGYVLNIGDSETNNGHGGDAGTTSNDAELDIIAPIIAPPYPDFDDETKVLPAYLLNIPLRVFPNDFSYPEHPRPMLQVDNFLKPQGKTSAKFIIKAKYVNSTNNSQNATLQSAYLLRLENVDLERPGGMNDKKWWIGVNRVICDPYGVRVGQGVTWIKFTLN